MADFLSGGLSRTLGVQLAQSLGLKVGSYLGRKIVLGACLSDEDDDLDPRHFRARTPTDKLPAAVDLRRWMTPVENQGAIGSCTANALASAVEYLALRGEGQRVDVSRLFIYFNQRLWRGSVRKDAGAAISWGIRVLAHLGVPDERMWPYHPDLFAVQPPEPVYRAALDHRIVDWCRVPLHGDAIRACLTEGFPIVFGVRTYSSFERIGKDGLCATPSSGEKDNGAHAMLLVGYDDAEQLFIVRNSWGIDWGDQGYCYLPYKYLLDPSFATSLWSVRSSGDLTFEEAEHAVFDPSSLPKAPPSSAAAGPVAPGGGGSRGGILGALTGGGTKVERAAGLATMFSGAAATLVTGNAALGGLFGGVVAGVAPALVDRLQRDDTGALLGDDRSQQIRAALKGADATAPPLKTPPRYHWDDGYDEEALSSGLRRGSMSQGAAPPAEAPPPPPSAARGGQPPQEPPPPPKEPPPPPPGESSARPEADPAAAALLERYEELGGSAGILGRDAGGPQSTTDGRSLWLPCEHGALVRHPAGPVYCLLGPIYLLWWQLGAFNGQLGYPTSDEYATGDERAPRGCRFEQGSLFYTPGYGAWLAP